MITRRTPIATDVQDVLRSLSVHEHVDEKTRALLVRVLAGESTEGILQEIRQTMHAPRSRSFNRLERMNENVLDALNQITFADVWAARIGPSTMRDVVRRAHALLDLACSDLGISHHLETST